MELRRDNEKYVSTFSGDTANFCVYLKRLCPDARVSYFSAVGSDGISQELLRYLETENINTELVFTTPHKTIGLYLINADADGERTFTYWRSDSAAKQMFTLLDEALLKRISQTTRYFYFSGISLAVLDPSGRDRLMALASKLRNTGKIVIFDPNLRLTLWDNLAQAREQIERAYGVCNILLSSFEDDSLLYGHTKADSTLENLEKFNIDEIVLTNGPGIITGVFEGRKFSLQPALPQTGIVDTTAAGDSFNAAYITARHNGYSPEQSAGKASELAARVIGQPGAIAPLSITRTID